SPSLSQWFNGDKWLSPVQLFLVFAAVWTASCFRNLVPTGSVAARVLLVKGDSGTRAYIIMYGAIAKTILLSALRICSSSVLRGVPSLPASSSAVVRFGIS